MSLSRRAALVHRLLRPKKAKPKRTPFKVLGLRTAAIGKMVVHGMMAEAEMNGVELVRWPQKRQRQKSNTLVVH